MNLNEETASAVKTKDEPLIKHIKKLIRKVSLDEIGQFLKLLEDNMAFITLIPESS